MILAAEYGQATTFDPAVNDDRSYGRFLPPRCSPAADPVSQPQLSARGPDSDGSGRGSQGAGRRFLRPAAQE